MCHGLNGEGVGGEGGGLLFLSVGVQNRGRTAASVAGVGLDIEGSNTHLPLGLLMQQGNAAGPAFAKRLEPYEDALWLVSVEPIVGQCIDEGRSTKVRPFIDFHGKRIKAAKAMDLVTIAGHNRTQTPDSTTSTP